MSWAKVKRINSNFKLPLNEQARQLLYSGAYLVTSTKDFTPDLSGWYKIICVGAGGTSSSSTCGCSGGVAIKTQFLDSANIYSIVVDSTGSSFDDVVKATSGTQKAVGTATGGDLNYDGISGTIAANGTGADVGVYIPGLIDAISTVSFQTDRAFTVSSGKGILGYGGGQGKYTYTWYDSNANSYEITVFSGTYPTGCVLIIPLEVTKNKEEA